MSTPQGPGGQSGSPSGDDARSVSSGGASPPDADSSDADDAGATTVYRPQDLADQARSGQGGGAGRACAGRPAGSAAGGTEPARRVGQPRNRRTASSPGSSRPTASEYRRRTGPGYQQPGPVPARLPPAGLRAAGLPQGAQQGYGQQPDSPAGLLAAGLPSRPTGNRARVASPARANTASSPTTRRTTRSRAASPADTVSPGTASRAIRPPGSSRTPRPAGRLRQPARRTTGSRLRPVRYGQPYGRPALRPAAAYGQQRSYGQPAGGYAGYPAGGAAARHRRAPKKSNQGLDHRARCGGGRGGAGGGGAVRLARLAEQEGVRRAPGRRRRRPAS